MAFLRTEKMSVPLDQDVYVFSLFGKEYRIPVNSAKTIVLFWVFCAICFLTYTVGKFDEQNAILTTAYLSHGHVIGTNGQPVYCDAILTPKKVIDWNCTDENLTGNYT